MKRSRLIPLSVLAALFVLSAPALAGGDPEHDGSAAPRPEARPRTKATAPAEPAAAKTERGRGTIFFLNRATRLFEALGLEAEIDGRTQPGIGAAELSGAEERELPILEGDLPPGLHRLHLRLTYRGSSGWLNDVFRYYRDYRFIISADYSFEILPGAANRIVLTAWDRGYSYDWPQRLALDFTSQPQTQGPSHP